MIKKYVILILAMIFSISGPVLTQSYADQEIVSFSSSDDLLERIKGMSLDFLMEWDNRVYLVVSPQELRELRRRRIPVIVETALFHQKDSERISAQTSLNGIFHSYKEAEKVMMDLAQDYPEIAAVVDIGDSLEGRNIYALKISDNVSAEENEPAVMITGCHHAREWISVEVPLLFCQHVVQNYASNLQIRQMVNQSEIWVIPIVNPDGLEYSIHYYRYWRKNMRNNADGTYGVDLNRNYGYMWGLDDEGSSSTTNSGVYRGTGPFSEPETQAVRDLFDQRDFQSLISYHSHGRVILYPWGYTRTPSTQETALKALGDGMAAVIQQVNGNTYRVARAGAGLYITNGDTTDWVFGVYGKPAYTFELPPIDRLHGEFYNSESDIQPIFNENLPALLHIIDYSIQNWSGDSNLTRQGQKRRLPKIDIHKIPIKK
ncbi:M14 family metallopeptidase [Acidobacteriota bacterium]